MCDNDNGSIKDMLVSALIEGQRLSGEGDYISCPIEHEKRQYPDLFEQNRLLKKEIYELRNKLNTLQIACDAISDAVDSMDDEISTNIRYKAALLAINAVLDDPNEGNINE